jgi:hypothetical protein
MHIAMPELATMFFHEGTVGRGDWNLAVWLRSSLNLLKFQRTKKPGHFKSTVYFKHTNFGRGNTNFCKLGQGGRHDGCHVSGAT